MPTPNDIADKVTRRLIELMETNGSNWKQPWVGSGLNRNAMSGKPYRGVNVLLTGGAGFGSPFWATFPQWQTMKAQVKKGSKATQIVFWKPLTIKDRESDEDKAIMMLKSYFVFNAEQVDNAPKLEITPLPELERHALCEDVIAMTGARISHGGDKAFYRPSTDSVHLPQPNQFTSPAGYYSVLWHEATHWTGHESRLSRNLTGRFGDEAYAAEEIIAELGSALLCAKTGITAEPREDHARYLNSWVKVLKGDRRAIFTFFSQAQKAADFIYPEAEPDAGPVRPGDNNNVEQTETLEHN